ncbi:gamma-glutamylcyclotransferase family protein [Nocardioides sp. Soil805]|uniref:gamma-glutamylcyclotransferase family protein n=1 Tax=Nocardioides sp. Soil805 TaxID=1736416 RepID=UPI0007035D94|nr:gamma-glutamylcyclotransferase [Nocardioides sp. Soil805]KRF37367.1 hypothetical protein ASG94_08580 [Nocardioides sp. Soil805]
MDHHATLRRLADLILVAAEHDVAAAQRVAAHAVAITMQRGGATVHLGEYAGHASAEVLGRDGRRMVIVPLFDWAPGDDVPGRWEYAVRDADGTLMARPDGDDAHGCADIWHVADHGLDLGSGTDEQHHMQHLMGDLLGWCLVLGENDPPGRVTPGQRATEYALDPYPGQRPYGSFVIDRDARCWQVRVDESRASGWAVEAAGGAVCLDAWLRDQGAIPLSARVPLLGYGSNASPGKVVANGTPLPSVHLACTMEDLASVWCVGDTRAARTPVTLDVVPGHVEQALVMMCDLDEMARLDQVEGRNSQWYDLVLLESGRVVLENGAHLPRPAVYVGGRAERCPMRLAGRPVLRVDLDHDQVRALRTHVTPTSVEPASLGPVVPVGVYPHPGDCVPHLFVYGTLKPGHERWPLLADYVVAEPVDATVAGDLRDTGYGWPALNAGTGCASGVLLRAEIAAMRQLLATLDEVEGLTAGLFCRQARAVGGQVAWVYVAGSCAGVGARLDSWPLGRPKVSSS